MSAVFPMANYLNEIDVAAPHLISIIWGDRRRALEAKDSQPGHTRNSSLRWQRSRPGIPTRMRPFPVAVTFLLSGKMQ
jgi:hypothetical protein